MNNRMTEAMLKSLRIPKRDVYFLNYLKDNIGDTYSIPSENEIFRAYWTHMEMELNKSVDYLKRNIVKGVKKSIEKSDEFLRSDIASNYNSWSSRGIYGAYNIINLEHFKKFDDIKIFKNLKGFGEWLPTVGTVLNFHTMTTPDESNFKKALAALDTAGDATGLYLAGAGISTLTPHGAIGGAALGLLVSSITSAMNFGGGILYDALPDKVQWMLDHPIRTLNNFAEERQKAMAEKLKKPHRILRKRIVNEPIRQHERVRLSKDMDFDNIYSDSIEKPLKFIKRNVLLAIKRKKEMNKYPNGSSRLYLENPKAFIKAIKNRKSSSNRQSSALNEHLKLKGLQKQKKISNSHPSIKTLQKHIKIEDRGLKYEIKPQSNQSSSLKNRIKTAFNRSKGALKEHLKLKSLQKPKTIFYSRPKVRALQEHIDIKNRGFNYDIKPQSNQTRNSNRNNFTININANALSVDEVANELASKIQLTMANTFA